MISALSSKISEKLCNANVIPRDEQELYSYGFFLLLSRGIFLIVAAVFGILFETLWESILFYILFSVLRGYAGGIHASKEVTCLCCTTLVLLLTAVGFQIMEEVGCVIVPLWILLGGGIVIFLLSPLDSEEKPLSAPERQHYRLISRSITVGITLLGLAGTLAGCNPILYVFSACLGVESILLMAGWIKERC